MPDKTEEARQLAAAHYQVEAGITQIFRITRAAAVELRPDEPVKLLEVNRYSIPSGIMPLHFDAAPRCEKLTKAHLCKAGSDPQQLPTSHAYVAKNLPIVLRQQMVVSGANLKGAPWVLQHAKHLAQEIEMLAPAVKRGGQRPDNCEYPWEDAGGQLQVPLDWSFSVRRMRARSAHHQNPKSEARNPKQTQNSNTKGSKQTPRSHRLAVSCSAWFGAFGF